MQQKVSIYLSNRVLKCHSRTSEATMPHEHQRPPCLTNIRGHHASRTSEATMPHEHQRPPCLTNIRGHHASRTSEATMPHEHQRPICLTNIRGHHTNYHTDVSATIAVTFTPELTIENQALTSNTYCMYNFGRVTALVTPLCLEAPIIL